MAIIGSNLKIQTELTTSLADGATGCTVDVGHVLISGLSYTGADVSTNIEDVADITAPSAWTNLVNLSGRMIIEISAHTGGEPPIEICIDENEGAGEDIRLQVIVDGTTVGDITVTRDAGGPIKNGFWGVMSASVTTIGIYWFECNSSFVIRACCEGDNFADAGTYVKHGSVRYSIIA